MRAAACTSNFSSTALHVLLQAVGRSSKQAKEEWTKPIDSLQVRKKRRCAGPSGRLPAASGPLRKRRSTTTVKMMTMLVRSTQLVSTYISASIHHRSHEYFLARQSFPISPEAENPEQTQRMQ